jgi:hypothetical protein
LGSVLVAVYLYAFPYFCELKSANELPRLFLTQEIVDRGTFQIDARLSELGSRFDVSTTPDGRHFSNKAPGLSFMAVPVYGMFRLTGRPPSLEAVTWACRVGAVTLPCLLFLLVLFPLIGRFVPPEEDRASQRVALAAYGLGSMALVYGVLFFSHAVAAACVGTAFALAVSYGRGGEVRSSLPVLGTGFLCAWSVVVDYQAVLAAAAVGVYLMARSGTRVRDGLLWAAGALPPAALLLAYHRVCFGSPFRTGYSFAVDTAHEQGVLGVIGPNAEAMQNALFTPDNGLLVLSPWMLLAIVGLGAVLADREARARVGAEVVVCFVVSAGYVLFVGSLVPEFGRAGWSVGPRYITVALPFLTCLAAAGMASVDRFAPFRILAHALVLVGIVVYVAAATTYPHWPVGFENPLYEVSFRALSEGLAPPSLGTRLGLQGAASLLPLYLAALVGVLVTMAGRGVGRWLTTGLAAAVAAAIVFGYGRFEGTRGGGEAKWQNVRKTMECGDERLEGTNTSAGARSVP